MNHGGTRLYRAVAVVALWFLAGGESAAQPQPVVERVDVARVIIDVRVVDNHGRPVLDLGPDDFEVRIGGEPVRVESAQWYGDDAPSAGRAGEPIPSTGVTGFLEPDQRGQLIVFVVQKSLYPQRVVGLMRLLQHSERLLQRVTPRDRVAVVSFDSHLKIWLDFTAELDQVRAVLADDVLFESPPVLEPQDGVSLLATLSQDAGRRTYEIQEALRRLGNALEPLPGAKSVVLVGYGFGQFTVTLGMIGATLDQRYEEARTALEAARAAVFCLDVTQADYHTFEHGLETVRRTRAGCSRGRTCIPGARSIGWPAQSRGTTCSSPSDPTSSRAATPSRSTCRATRAPCWRAAPTWSERRGGTYNGDGFAGAGTAITEGHRCERPWQRQPSL